MANADAWLAGRHRHRFLSDRDVPRLPLLPCRGICGCVRNASRELTLFYLIFATGGAIGSFLIGIAFPLLFSSNYDVAISFFATALAALLVVWPENWSQRLLWSAGSAACCIVLVLLHAAYRRDTLFATRNFYATLRVKQTYDSNQHWMRTLSNGIILHGTQIFTPALSKTPTTYYAEDSGVGLALRYCCGERARNVGIVGLGAGTIAAYGRPGDRMRFYEINPAVQPIAQHLFTYLRDSPAQITFCGRRRASLAGEGSPAALRCAGGRCLLRRRHTAAPADAGSVPDLQTAILHRAAYSPSTSPIGMSIWSLRFIAGAVRRHAGAHGAELCRTTSAANPMPPGCWSPTMAAFLALPAVADYSREPEQRAGLPDLDR